MKKYCSWKKAAAFAMSMALVTGAMPANVGGFFKANSGIVASAAEETKEPAVGAFFKTGDTIKITKTTYFVVDNAPSSASFSLAAIDNDVTLNSRDYEDGQYVWRTGVQFTDFHNGFYVTGEYSENNAPEGFYIIGGNGTQDAPFTIGLAAPKFNGKNITLNDGISINFIVSEVNENNFDDIKVKFTGDCAEAGDTLLSLDIKTIKEKEYYCATANVTANKMDSVITAELYYDNSEEPFDTVSSSVNDYLDAVDNINNEKLHNIVSATRQYGAVSAAYFGNGELPQVANHSDEILKEPENTGYFRYLGSFVPSLEGDSDEPFASRKMESSDAIISLVLNSKLAGRLYLANYDSTVTDEDYKKAAYDIWTPNPDAWFGYDITDPDYIEAFEGANGKYCFEIPGITPTQLGTTFNINWKGYDYKFKPLSWAYRVLSAEGAPAKDVAMANALYEYYIAATNYVG